MPTENRFALTPFLKLYFAIELSSLLKFYLFIYLRIYSYVIIRFVLGFAFPIVANKSKYVRGGGGGLDRDLQRSFFF